MSTAQHGKPTASDLTLEELNRLKDGTAGAISDILNRFSVQTGLRIESVELDKAFTYGCPNHYCVKLDVRL